jgi:7-cyano-7-deazaguanine synthase in queuosine biosynthesis
MAHDDWMSQLMAFVNGMKRNEAVLFNAPLWPMRTPDDTFAKARELGVPIDMTAVCKLDLACGECFHCRDRERLLHA